MRKILQKCALQVSNKTCFKNEKYYTAHGCLFLPLGRRKIGKEIFVFKNEKYGKEVFKCFDFRIEMIALLVFLFGAFLIFAGL